MTALAALTAAMGTIYNAWRQRSERRDRIRVVFGPVDPQLEPKDYLFVVNLSEHSVFILDFGLVLRDGGLVALAQLTAYDVSDGWKVIRGSRELSKMNDLFEAAVYVGRQPDVIGAYATTSTLKVPSLGFSGSVGVWRRFWILLKLNFRRRYTTEIVIR